MKMREINGRTVWGIFMVIFYFGLSFLLVFTNAFEDNMSFTVRMAFGFLFTCYAIFRIYRLIKVGK